MHDLDKWAAVNQEHRWTPRTPARNAALKLCAEALRTVAERDDFLQEHGFKEEKPCRAGMAGPVGVLRKLKSGRGGKDMYTGGFANVLRGLPYFYACGCIPMPQDFMHVELQGLLPLELAAFIYKAERTLGWPDFLERLNRAIAIFDFPPGQRPPAIFTNVLKGSADGDPYKGAHVQWSAGQMMHFAEYSTKIIEPLLPPGGAEEPIWLCWRAHMAYFHLLMSNDFTVSLALELDRCIMKHDELFTAAYACLD